MRSWTRTPPKLRKTREDVEPGRDAGARDRRRARQGDAEAVAADVAQKIRSGWRSSPSGSRRCGSGRRRWPRISASRGSAPTASRCRCPTDCSPGCATRGSTWSAPSDDLRGAGAARGGGRRGAGAREAESDEAADAAAAAAARISRWARAWTRSRCGFRAPTSSARRKEFRQDLLDAMKRGGAGGISQSSSSATTRSWPSEARSLRSRSMAVPSAATRRARVVARSACYELVEEQRIEEAQKELERAGARQAARSGGRVRRRRSGAASRAVRARRRSLRRGERSCAGALGEDARAAARSGARHRRDDQGLRGARRQALRGVARSRAATICSRPTRSTTLERALAALGDDFGWAAARADPRRDLSRGRRSGARLDADAQGDRDVGDDRAVQVQPAR